MLKLLRKTGSQSTEKNIHTFWVSTISEFVLVILSILIALQIDNWNQNRLEKKQEKILLKELIVNLKSDLKDLEVNVNLLTIVLNSSDTILTYFEEDRPYNDSLKYHFGNLNGGTIYNRNLSTYESLKSIGIGLISNDILRQQITYLYSVKYDFLLKLEEMHHKVMSELLYPSLAKQLNTTGFFQTATPLNFAEIKNDNVFKESVKQNTFFVKLQIQEYQSAKVLILELIEGIEKELNPENSIN